MGLKMKKFVIQWRKFESKTAYGPKPGWSIHDEEEMKLWIFEDE